MNSWTREMPTAVAGCRGHPGRNSVRLRIVVATLGVCACASRPRDPVLDSYPAGVSGRTTVVYYDVHGSTIPELRADMHKSGPKISDTSFVAETRSPMRWTYRWEQQGISTCLVRDLRIYV